MENAPLSSQDEESHILEKVSKGMRVFDRDHHAIGTVKGVYLGEASNEVEEEGKGPTTTTPNVGIEGYEITPDFAFGGAANTTHDDSEEGRWLTEQRLKQEGFIRIDISTPFADDRYATSQQVASVQGDDVILKVDENELIDL